MRTIYQSCEIPDSQSYRYVGKNDDDNDDDDDEMMMVIMMMLMRRRRVTIKLLEIKAKKVTYRLCKYNILSAPTYRDKRSILSTEVRKDN